AAHHSWNTRQTPSVEPTQKEAHISPAQPTCAHRTTHPHQQPGPDQPKYSQRANRRAAAMTPECSSGQPASTPSEQSYSHEHPTCQPGCNNQPQPSGHPLLNSGDLILKKT